MSQIRAGELFLVPSYSTQERKVPGHLATARDPNHGRQSFLEEAEKPRWKAKRRTFWSKRPGAMLGPGTPVASSEWISAASSAPIVSLPPYSVYLDLMPPDITVTEILDETTRASP
jgi:hypothetical protein